MPKTSKAKAPSNLPKGWIMSGAHPKLYEASVVTSSPHSGTRCAYLRNSPEVTNSDTWATLMQEMGPLPYLEKRLRMSFWVRTRDVAHRAQPWMRVDGQKEDECLSFDNMCKRHIQGTTEWTEHSIVLDVPNQSTNIAFGILLCGKGHVWFDDVTFDVVGNDVPITDCPCSNRNLSKKPENLNFEEG